MSSSLNSEFKCSYDIFLSFRGLDTSTKFTDHLYKALKREGFQTFRDDDEIERGENIKSELGKAIWNSRMSVIVLSKNYATSTSCLFEIHTIIEHRRKKLDHFILPVFYEVDPWEIKQQAKSLDFGKKEVTVEQVKGWSAALKVVANMAGMVQCNGYEAKFIEDIIGLLKSKQVGKHRRVGDYLDENLQNMSSLETEDFTESQLDPTERLVSGIYGGGTGPSHGNKLPENKGKVSYILPSPVPPPSHFFESENGVDSGVIQPEESCRCFSLDEILISTNNFDEASVIGKGGFGKVYKGFIDDGAMIVAIKRLNAESKQGAGEFWTEIKMLRKLQHTNLVGLIGHCNERQEMILVYDYMAQGTLASHLYGIGRPESGTSISPLTWEQRLDICIDAARGLNYLHSGTDRTFIHRDVKTTNILLDKNWVAKISDFGLSKGTKSHLTTHISTKVKGTFGYFDPDYFVTQRLTMKSDVYAFGVVLLEVLCGRPAVDTSLEEEQISLVDWVQHCIEKKKLDGVIDPSLDKQISPRCLKSFVQLVINCLKKSPRSRPTMAQVLDSLELALVSQQKERLNGIGLQVATGIVLLYDKLKNIKFLW